MTSRKLSILIEPADIPAYKDPIPDRYVFWVWVRDYFSRTCMVSITVNSNYSLLSCVTVRMTESTNLGGIQMSDNAMLSSSEVLLEFTHQLCIALRLGYLSLYRDDIARPRANKFQIRFSPVITVTTPVALCCQQRQGVNA